ncbi:aldo/keto reductase [Candidatus Bipolaricaulota bacterium]
MIIPRFELAPSYSISRIILGGWQLAHGHGQQKIGRATTDELLRGALRAGVTTLDCADIYTGVEELIGTFLGSTRPDVPVQIHTKYVPDLSALSTLTERDTRQTVERSLRRLGVERLDLVQFHWWDFDIPGYVEAALTLDRLRKGGRISHIGVTNFDASHLSELLDAGVPVIANQVQYSVLDRRPEDEMAQLCEEHGISLLCYGTLAGGFLSDAYLGVSEPREPFENRSLVKYRLIIDEYGNWERFQHLLRALRAIGDRHDADISAVASRLVLDRPHVAASVTGIRSPVYLQEAEHVFSLELDPGDLAELSACFAEAAGPLGPVYGLERVKGGRHARIMRTDLNRLNPAANHRPTR